MEHSVKLEIEILEISRRRSRSPDDAKFGRLLRISRYCKVIWLVSHCQNYFEIEYGTQR